MDDMHDLWEEERSRKTLGVVFGRYDGYVRVFSVGRNDEQTTVRFEVGCWMGNKVLDTQVWYDDARGAMFATALSRGRDGVYVWYPDKGLGPRGGNRELEKAFVALCESLWPFFRAVSEFADQLDLTYSDLQKMDLESFLPDAEEQ